MNFSKKICLILIALSILMLSLSFVSAADDSLGVSATDSSLEFGDSSLGVVGSSLEFGDSSLGVVGSSLGVVGSSLEFGDSSLGVVGSSLSADSDYYLNEDNYLDLNSKDNQNIGSQANKSKENILSASYGNELLSATRTPSAQTFSAIQSAIDSASSGDTIQLSGTYAGSAVIKVSKKLTIEGIGSGAVLNAGGSAGIMNITGSGVVVKNIWFINSKNAGDKGAALVINKDLPTTVNNCTFINNSARGSESAGAIYNQGNSNITKCTFINNTCSVEEGAGAIFADSSGDDLNVQFCIFMNNTKQNARHDIWNNSERANFDCNYWGRNFTSLEDLRTSGYTTDKKKNRNYIGYYTNLQESNGVYTFYCSVGNDVTSRMPEWFSSGSSSPADTALSLGINSGSNNRTGGGKTSVTVYSGNYITLIANLNPNSSSDLKLVIWRNDTSNYIYNGTFSGGWFSQPVSVGSYKYYVVFEGNGTYGPSTSNAVTVDVLPLVRSTTTTVNVNPSSINPGDTVTVSPTVKYGSTTVTWGTVEIYLNNNAVKNITAGSSWDISSSVAGSNNITAKYLGEVNGEYNYTGSQGTASFKVRSSLDLTLGVNSGYNNQTAGGKEAITINGGQVTFIVGLSSYSSGSIKLALYNNTRLVDNETWSLWHPRTLPSNIEKTYEFYVVFEGDDDYMPATSNSVTVNVVYPSQATVTTVSVSPNSVDQGQSVTIRPTVMYNEYYAVTEGNVEIYLNGNAIRNITAGTSLTIDADIAGVNNVTAKYLGTHSASSYKTFTESEGSTNFFVNKLAEDTAISLYVNAGQNNASESTQDYVSVYANEYITLIPDLSPNGDNVRYLIKRNGTEISNSILENGYFTVQMLAVGEYIFTAEFEGNASYNPAGPALVRVNVLPIPTSLSIFASDVSYPNRVAVNHDLTAIDGSSSFSALIEYFIGEESKGTASVTDDFLLPLLDVGNYTVFAKYLGDAVYADSISNAIKVEVLKSNSTISYQIEDDKLVTNLSQGTTGNITYILDGVVLDDVVLNESSQAYLDISSLKPGNHTVIVKYSGDKNYNKLMSYYRLEIPKWDIEISIENIVSVYPNMEVIAVTANASGNYIVSIGGKRYSVYIELEEGARTGQANAQIDLLDVNTYEYEVSISESEYYNAQSKSAYYTVNPAGLYLTISGDESIAYGENEVIVPKFSHLASLDSLSGNITYALKDSDDNIIAILSELDIGINFATDDLDLSQTFSNGLLDAGVYKIIAHYNGNDYYLGVDSNEFEFTVEKALINLEIADVEVVYPNRALVTIASDAEGLYIISVNGVSYPVELKGSTGFTDAIELLDVGSYDILVSASIDNYREIHLEKYAEYTVKQAETILDIGDDLLIDFGSAFTISPQLTDGENILSTENTDALISYYLAGIKVSELDLDKTFSSGILNAGTYSLYAVYAGDGNYAGSKSNTISIEIDKIIPSLTVQGTAITYGEDAIVQIGLSGLQGIKLTGIVNMTIAGKDYAVAVSDGEANFTIKGLNASDMAYAIHAISLENGNYKSSVNDEGRIFVSKSDNAEFNVELVGDEIIITLSDDYRLIDALVNISINGGESEELSIENGKAVIPTDGLSDTVNMDLSFEGNNNYNPSHLNKDINLNSNVREDLDIHIAANTIDYGDDEIISILLKNNKGDILPFFDLNLTINGETVAVTTDSEGKIDYKVPYNLNAGSYEAVISYDGGITYNSISRSNGFNVNRLGTIIEASSFTTYAGSGDYMSFCLKDSNGRILSDKNIIIAFDGKKYNLTTDSNGIVKLQIILESKGTYSLTASFGGDENYNSSLEVYNVVVKPKSLDIVVNNLTYNAKDNGKYLIATLKSEGNPVANKAITFYINGKTYNVISDSNGIVKVGISLTAKKTYLVTVKYDGDNTYSYAFNKFNLKVI